MLGLRQLIGCGLLLMTKIMYRYHIKYIIIIFNH
jgi:hypothetical protein